MLQNIWSSTLQLFLRPPLSAIDFWLTWPVDLTYFLDTSSSSFCLRLQIIIMLLCIRKHTTAYASNYTILSNHFLSILFPIFIINRICLKVYMYSILFIRKTYHGKGAIEYNGNYNNISAH